MPRKPKNNVDAAASDDVEKSCSYRNIEHEAETQSEGYLSKPSSGHRRRSSAGSHRDLLFNAMFNVQEDFSKTTTSKLSMSLCIGTTERRPSFGGPQEIDFCYQRSIYQLCREGDVDTLVWKLSSQQNIKDADEVREAINYPDHDGHCALHYACRYNRLEVVKLLVMRGADINKKTEIGGLAPLHLSAMRPTLSGVLTSIVPSMNTDDEQESRPKMVKGVKDAMRQHPKCEKSYTRESVIKYLVSKHADVNVKDDTYGLTPLHYAVKKGNVEAVLDLITYSDINIECEMEGLKLTPLHVACEYGHEEITRILIEMGSANLSAKNKKRQTLLHKACEMDRVNILKILLRAGEKAYGRPKLEQLLVKYDIDGNTPMTLAIKKKSAEAITELLDFGVDVNHCNDRKESLMHIACAEGSLDIVELLINAGGNIEQRDRFGHPPLTFAIKRRSPEHLAIVEYLVRRRGAKVNTESMYGYTPLIVAAWHGNTSAVEMLLEEGADAFAKDSTDMTSLHWAASHEHPEIVKLLLKDRNNHQLLHEPDRYHVTALHLAAEKGHVRSAEEMLSWGANVHCRDDHEMTPIHLAAQQGRVELCLLLLNHDKSTAYDEDSGSQTPLHLACAADHPEVARVLLDHGAPADNRDCNLWTPLGCAARRGNLACVLVMLEEKYSVDIDPVHPEADSPLCLAAMSGSVEMVNLLIKKGASLLGAGARQNVLTTAILCGRKEVAASLIEMDKWRILMMNDIREPVTGKPTTPLRLLIKQFPDLAERIFDRCVKANYHTDATSAWQANTKLDAAPISPDDPKFSVTFNYELLDDAYMSFPVYKVYSDVVNPEEKIDRREHHIRDGKDGYAIMKKIWSDRDNHLLSTIEARQLTTAEIKMNHPLMLMVKEQRTSLLGHPLCMALVRYKWNRLGRYIYFVILFFYLLFVASVTLFTLSTPAPYSPSQILAASKWKENASDPDVLETLQHLLDMSKDEGYGTIESCLAVEVYTGVRRRFVTEVSKVLIVCLAVIHMLKETLQLTRNRLAYLNVTNFIEWTCYVTAMVFVIDFSDCHKSTGLRYGWQWQVGTLCVIMTWFNLLINIRKFPFLGIYIVMFTDVLVTFLKLSIIIVLFIVAFSLGFHCLLGERDYFMHPFFSVLKTAVMMVGEMEFADLFLNEKEVPYETFSLSLFFVFVIVMTIIVMNLLVGLAVDDIKAVQDTANLKRLAMLVTLSLDVEMLLPEFIRRKIVLRRQTLFPNTMGSIFEKVYKDGHTMQSIKDAVVAMANETVIEQMSTRQQEIMRNVGALPKLANEVRDLRRQLERKGQQSKRQSRISCRSRSPSRERRLSGSTRTLGEDLRRASISTTPETRSIRSDNAHGQ